MRYQTELDDIKRVIHSRYDYFKQVSGYLDDVQKGKVKKTEIVAFINDVTGIDCHDENTIIFDVIPPIIDCVAQNVKRYSNYLTCLKDKELAIGLSTLDILLEYDTVISSTKSSLQSDTSVSLRDRASMAFHDVDVRKELKTSLQQHLPIEHNNILDIIRIKAQTRTKRTGRHHLTESNTLLMTYDFRWTRFRNFFLEHDKEISKITKSNLHDKSNTKTLSGSEIEAFLELGIDVLELQTKISNITIFNNRELANPNVNHWLLVRKNVQHYYDLLPCKQKTIDMVNQAKEQYHHKKELEKLTRKIDHCQKAIDSHHKEIVTPLAFIKANKNWLPEAGQADHQQLTQKYLDLPQQIKQVRENWTPTTNENSTLTDDNFQQLQTQAQQQIDRLTNLKNDVSALLQLVKMQQQYIKDRIAADQQQQASVSSQTQNDAYRSAQRAHELKTLAEKQAHEDFIQAQQEKRLAWQAEVAQHRALTANRPRIINPDLSIFPPPTEQRLNPFMRDTLAGLNTRHTTLLESILQRQVGVKYRDVVNLITNQLHGRVLDAGHGGSRKRIELGALYSEFYTHADNENYAETPADTQPNSQTNAQSNAAITGGVAKPHGRAKNSGELSPFNLKLLCVTFEKAGITLETLRECQAQAASQHHSANQIPQATSSIAAKK